MGWERAHMSFETIAVIASLAISAASTTYSIVSGGGGGSKETPPPKSDDKAAQQAAYAEAERLRRKRGAAGTVVTGPEGLPGDPTLGKSRLGD